MLIKKLTFFLLPLLFIISCGTPDHQVGATGEHAMVVCAHPLATKAGLEVLRQGGNAIDAAVATQFALAVVYPRAGNIGGGGFAVIRFGDGQVNTLDFREKAPAAATRTMYEDSTGTVNSELSTLGHLAVGVPGSVAGMWQLHQQYGSLPWKDLVEPAVLLAAKGFKITAKEAESLNRYQEDFKKANLFTPWVIQDQPWKEGDLATQPQLATTLSLIRDSGRDGFYQGAVADQLVEEMQAGGGLITHEDLKNYEAAWREPVISQFKDYKIIGMPPSSSGGVAVAQLLQGAELLKLETYPHNSTQYVHLVAELERRVFADRAEYLGDPEYMTVPVAALIDPAYNQKRFAHISSDHATPSSEVSAGRPLHAESMETTHYSIVDPFGNAISITTTLNGNYGSKVMVQKAGFFLNNEMDDFSAKPGVPNMFGLVGAEANAIAPNKRMLSSMSPSIVEGPDGQLKMVVGTPGGSTIITTVFQTILNVIDYDMTMQEAVNAKKFHHQWLPDQIMVEAGALSPDEVSELEAMGHSVKEIPQIGRTDCILITKGGLLEGGADPRGDDYAEGF